MKKKISILGSTGSIGVSTLDVLTRHVDKFDVFALSANRNIDCLVEQCQQFNPSYVVLADASLADTLKLKLDQIQFAGELLLGTEGLVKIAAHPEVDMVMAAIVGGSGLLPTLAAAQAGKQILLANKESLVMSGKLFMDTVKQSKATVIPIDSEHNAIFQCFPRQGQRGLSKIILTASGGPFRLTPLENLEAVTPEQACAHPKWKMGRKISVDSATMMNKALEIIEAHYLFDIPPSKIEVLLHPQSIVHSMVEYEDGSVLAQMGNPDMRTPIAYGLGYPERIESGVPRLNLAGENLNFEKLDEVRFPAIKLAYKALELGGTAATIINAANEGAVQAFLAGSLKFTDIYRLIDETLAMSEISPADTLEEILAADKLTCSHAKNIIKFIGR